jgi:hypothetical protein
MRVEYKKTKTGWKFRIASILNDEKIVHSWILCSRRPNFQEAEKAAHEHIKKTLISFNRFPTVSEYQDLPILF